MSDTRTTVAQANLLHEALWGKRPKLGPHPAIVDALAEAEQRGYERALAEARAKIEALDYSDTKQRDDVLAVLDALRGGGAG